MDMNHVYVEHLRGKTSLAFLFVLVISQKLGQK